MKHANTAKLKQDVDEMRSWLERDADELERRVSGKLSYEGVVDEAAKRLKASGARDYLDNLYRDSRENPMSLVLFAAAIGLLFRKRSAAPRFSETGEEIGEGFEKASHWTRDRVSGIGSRVRDRFRSTSEGASGTVRRIDTSRREAYGRGRDFFSEYPMALLGAGVAVGAFFAAFIPTTRLEKERLGPYSEELKDRVQEKTEEFKAQMNEGSEPGAGGI